MKAARLHAYGGPEQLVYEDAPEPAPKAGEVLIRISATGVNRPDLAQRAGTYPPPPGASDLPGLEAAGTIAALLPVIGLAQLSFAVSTVVPESNWSRGAGWRRRRISRHCWKWDRGMQRPTSRPCSS